LKERRGIPVLVAKSIFVKPLRLRATVSLDGLKTRLGLATLFTLDLNVDFGSLGGIVADLNVIAAERDRRQNNPFSPRIDLTFTNKLFFTTIVQYNTRYNNTGLNARLQWRFKPASDFFIVYTENYFSDNMQSRNRALVLKLTYWFNL